MKWWKPMLAMLAVALPTLFNYLSARIDSNEAKIRAEVAYAMTVDEVQKLQSLVHALELDHAEMKGKIYELERVHAAHTGAALPAPPEPAASNAMVSPPAFEDAVRSYKAAAKK